MDVPEAVIRLLIDARPELPETVESMVDRAIPHRIILRAKYTRARSLVLFLEVVEDKVVIYTFDDVFRRLDTKQVWLSDPNFCGQAWGLALKRINSEIL